MPPQVAKDLLMIGSCWLFIRLQLYEMLSAELPAEWALLALAL
jgi:hypothetical protein